MNIALIGYGKMGKEIEKIALERGHHISFRINIENKEDLFKINSNNTDVAIEFTQPETAFENIQITLNNKVSIVSGTTGWLDRQSEVEQLAVSQEKAFFYASNFSLGVNLFFQLNEYLAKLMSKHSQYQLSMEEIHHTEKKDAPSGTAISLAKGIIENYPQKISWVNQKTEAQEEIGIISKREPHVPGTHVITYSSPEDFIEIKHEAYSRKGFALGAVLAAEFIKDKKGVLGMKDLLTGAL